MTTNLVNHKGFVTEIQIHNSSYIYLLITIEFSKDIHGEDSSQPYYQVDY